MNYGNTYQIMKKNNLIKVLKKQLMEVEKILAENYTVLDSIITDIPDDPSIGIDVLGDGILNENPHLKLEYLTSIQHVIGYCEGRKHTINEMLELLNITSKEYLEQIKQVKINENENNQLLINIIK